MQSNIPDIEVKATPLVEIVTTFEELLEVERQIERESDRDD